MAQIKSVRFRNLLVYELYKHTFEFGDVVNGAKITIFGIKCVGFVYFVRKFSSYEESIVFQSVAFAI